MTDRKEVRKVDTDEIEGEYILKNTDPDKKKIIFSTVIWYDPEAGKYYFKSESDMNGNVLAGQVVSHKLIQDLLTISKWTLKPHGELWNDPSRVHSGGVNIEDDQKKDDAGPKYAGAPYNRERDEDDIRRALKRQDDQKKAENNAKDVLYRDKVARGKPKRWGKRKLTPAQREERDKELAAIKREGCCARCHRRITPESQSTFDEHYLCKWCDQKNHTNCKENEYSDFEKEDSK